jgi:hypothetical protein
VRPVPVLVPTPLPILKPGLTELKSSGGISEVEARPHAVHAGPVKPEAALNIVIRTSNQAASPVELPVEPPVSEPVSPDQTPAVPAPAAAAPVGDNVPPSAVSQAASYEVAAAAAPSAAANDRDHRKLSSGTDAIAPDTAAAKPIAPQTAAFQDLQLKAEPAKNESAGPRPATPSAPAAAPERIVPEKNGVQVKSIALEFTPDGSRDVKVRLSERGGEVHVSVHSTDPAITTSLRAGVSDLASILEHAGYDAKAWTNDRQQQGNPQQQQQEEQRQQHRASRSADSGRQFESILQHPNQENS